MRRMHAQAVEVFSEFEETLTVHFDDTGDHYLQLQAPAEGYEEEYAGIYVEVDDQGLGDYGCFSRVELHRGSFRMAFRPDGPLGKVGDIEVTFDLDAAAFADLRQGLERVFRGYGDFHVVA